MVTNAEAAALLREIADLLDLQGERFKPEAYRRAARSIDTLTEELAAVARRGALREIPGVGEAIEEKLGEYLASGQVPYLERLRGEVPPGLAEIMRLPGIGPKTARRFWTELGVTDRAALAHAIEDGRLAGRPGFGAKKIELVRAAVEAAGRTAPAGRRPIETVVALAGSIRSALLASSPAQQVEIAGSFRRGRETVGDLDILVTSTEPERVFDVFSQLPVVATVQQRGETKETVLLVGGLQVDLRVVAPEAFGAALQYFTGSKEHNVRLRSLARDRGLKINEYGVFRGETRVAGRTEEEVYGAIGLPWIPPELREDRGEIDLAREGHLPRLVEGGDLVEELHLHPPPEAGATWLPAVTAEAAELGVRTVGVVVVAPGTPGVPSVVADELRRASGRPSRGRVRLVPVVEVEPGGPPAEAAPWAAAARVLRPGAGGALPEPDAVPSPGVRLIAHVGGDPVAAHRWVGLAKRLGAAVEVGPGAERLDSSVARSALEQGVRLGLPTGIGSSDGSVTRGVALGFARRASATAAEVANAGSTGSRPAARPLVRPG